LHGLKQAPRYWFAKLSNALKNYGFKQSYGDYLLFSLHKGDLTIHVLLYVDDLIISGNTHEGIKACKRYLSQCFHMKDLGRLKYLLGVEVGQGDNCGNKNMLWTAGFLGAKPSTLPTEQNHQLPLAAGWSLSQLDRYYKLLGHLLCLSFT